VTNPRNVVFLKPDPLPYLAEGTARAISENCKKLKNLGFEVSRRVRMYGEQFEIVSDPFSEGDGIAVRATSGTDPAIRTLRLPTALLVGAEDRFLKKPKRIA
jgi:hypothetical protein